jgi:hypothetical protein
VALTVTADLAPADWIATSTLDWSRLIEFGPSGFPAYARLRFMPDPSYPGQSENDAPDEGEERYAWRTRQWGVLMRLLGARTSTPGDCYACVWDGYGSSDAGEPPRAPQGSGDSLRRMPERYRDDPTGHWTVAPSAPRTPTRTPKLVVPNREYYLFRGTVDDVARWEDARYSPELRVEHLRVNAPELAFVWPADRAWCVAFDVDPHWAGIGASVEAVDALVADENLDAVPADPGADQPHYY